MEHGRCRVTAASRAAGTGPRRWSRNATVTPERATLLDMQASKKAVATRIVYERKDGSWGWKLRGDDGEFLATNGNHHFKTEAEARKMADGILGGAFKDATKQVSRRTP
jgi:hypothetical protein